MKATSNRCVLGLFIGLLALNLRQVLAEDPAALYAEWHSVLAASPWSDFPQWFATPPCAPFAEVEKKIDANRIAMAYFLCQKLSEENPDGVSYADFAFLMRVTGINLMWADDRPYEEQDTFQNRPRFLRQFQKEWKQGVYERPDARIDAIYKRQLPKIEPGKLHGVELSRIRWYGIFGVPEFVRQIKQTNSAHAFADFLILTDQRFLYTDYLEKSGTLFTTREEKLQHIRNWLARLGLEDKRKEFPLIGRIQEALDRKD